MLARSLLAIAVLAIATPAFAANEVDNPSFEDPPVPDGFPAVPFATDWTQVGLANTSGVFKNTAFGAPDHISNALGAQLAFLSGNTGNALQQQLPLNYVVGMSYDLTVGVAVSAAFPPLGTDELELVFYYLDGVTPVDIAVTDVTLTGLSSTLLVDKTVSVPTLTGSEDYLNEPIHIAFRSAGGPNGFWDLDNVRFTAVPEPASLAVLSLGTLALIARRRNKA